MAAETAKRNEIERLFEDADTFFQDQTQSKLMF